MTTTAKQRKFSKGDTHAPAEAFRFAASAVTFSEGDEQSKSKPFRMVARTAEPVAHWYWGRIVHDFAGMASKPTVAVDWMHSPYDLIGKAEVDTSSGELVAEGTIESIEVGDYADKIMKLSAAGVPYEGSIDFDPYELVLENVPEGFVAEANGRTYDGPLLIAREWRLRRIAFCPSGVDGNSEVRFSSPDAATEFSLTVKECESMSKATNADSGKNEFKAPDNANAAPADDARTKFAAELKRYTDKFGPADGATYFSDGLSYEAALERHVTKLEEARKASDAAKLSAEQRLAALNLGETRAVESGGTKPDETKTSFSSCYQAATRRAMQKAAGEPSAN